ncbi:hypothetical protein GVN16_15560 [Emticicia sp. CRIBPO]|uniref:hypothetical protein n=1 Tax=Emticicia sp. CRIBPO TaxID=2683258 RepID=UPI0014131C2B|nr:hypothetical protein [Emticicia sp. CRIBPO]NBA87189.1 hypothetical protein [Emticicia sp. CRIBPO]
MNKKATPFLFLIFGLILGIVIGYLFLSSTLQMDFNRNGFTGGTQPICREEAKKLADGFKEKLKSALGFNHSKLISWPDDLHGWILDARMVNHYLLQQQGYINDPKRVTHIYVELGYDKDEKKSTLIFTGLEKKDGKYYRILLGQAGAPCNLPKKLNDPGDNILEYVDPCKNNCPEETTFVGAKY